MGNYKMDTLNNQSQMQLSISIPSGRSLTLTGGDLSELISLLVQVATAVPSALKAVAAVLEWWPDNTQVDKLGKKLRAFVESLESR